MLRCRLLQQFFVWNLVCRTIRWPTPMPICEWLEQSYDSDCCTV